MTITQKQKRFQRICTSSSSTLWCWCDSSELIQLDCRTSPPQVKSRIEISKQIDMCMDMCFLNNCDKALVVVPQFSSGLAAYNTETGQIEWRLTGRLKDGKFYPVSHSPTTVGTTISFARVATDGRGHIFAVDFSGFLYVLASDGKHLFSLTGRRFLNLNLVKTVRWFEKASTLIVSHRETRFTRDAITYMNVK